MRRAFVPILVALAVLGVGAGAVVRAARDGRPRIAVDERAAEGRELPAGYWVWRRVETPAGVQEITSADLAARVGPRGWPGCPERFVCTRHGIRTLAIGPTGGFHYVANVFTSSDFQHHGSIRGDEVRLVERFSCAHPGWRSARRERRRLHWERDGEDLRLAIDPRVEGGGWPFANRETGVWWTFRRISREAYYASRLLRLCQPVAGHACAPMCFSEHLVTEPVGP